MTAGAASPRSPASARPTPTSRPRSAWPPRRRSSSEEDRAQYRDELEQVAAPLEQRALDTLQKGLAKAYELGIYTDWTLRAQDDVNALQPGTYPPKTRVALRAPDPAAPLAAPDGSAPVALGKRSER